MVLEIILTFSAVVAVAGVLEGLLGIGGGLMIVPSTVLGAIPKRGHAENGCKSAKIDHFFARLENARHEVNSYG
jgi:hypothetical protein